MQDWERDDQEVLIAQFDQYRDNSMYSEEMDLTYLDAQIRYPSVFPKRPIPPGYLIRHTFNWVPSRVEFTSNGRAAFLDDINMIERRCNQPLYQGLEQVLGVMCPMLRAQGILKSTEEPCTLRVIVKVTTGRPSVSPFLLFVYLTRKKGPKIHSQTIGNIQRVLAR